VGKRPAFEGAVLPLFAIRLGLSDTVTPIPIPPQLASGVQEDGYTERLDWRPALITSSSPLRLGSATSPRRPIGVGRARPATALGIS
jgi:hypothetical protein